MLRKHNFNLIEIIIALGIVLVGICSLMVIFPIGANASRDAAVEIESANAVEQFLNLMKYKVKNGNGTWIGENLRRNSDPAFPEIEPDGWTPVEKLSGIQMLLFKNGTKGLFLLISLRSTSNMKFSNWENKAYSEIVSAFEDGTILIDRRMILRAECISTDPSEGEISVEVSWPAEIPYTQRKKEIFVLTLKQ